MSSHVFSREYVNGCLYILDWQQATSLSDSSDLTDHDFNNFVAFVGPTKHSLADWTRLITDTVWPLTDGPMFCVKEINLFNWLPAHVRSCCTCLFFVVFLSQK
jgi:hypothetical protein